MPLKANYVVMNGKIVSAKNAHVSLLTHGFSYGTGCFEGIRGYWNSETEDIYLFRALEHFQRLHKSCTILNMKLQYSPEELVQQCVDLVRKNDWHENIYLRPMVYKADEIIGVKLHDLTDHYYIVAQPMGDYVPTTGIACGVSSWRRIDDNMVPARAKITGGYINSALAKTEANKNGFGEAILLNADGHVAEGSGENIFLYVNGELITPAATDNILLGITRDTVMQLAAQQLETITRERSIDRTELYTADEIFLCGTGAQIAPVIAVDHRPIGTGQIGSFSARMKDLYGAVVRGHYPQYGHWLTPIYGSLPQVRETTETASPAHI